MKITQITRKDLFDAMVIEKVNWAGTLEESEFLSRLYDLSSLPSTDQRFPDAVGDIWQHRVNNYDWEDPWVFYDRRFQLMNGDDEILLRFLAESVHPVVRPDVTECQKLVHLYNSFLINDGFEIAERTRISGKPIYIGRNVGVVSLPGVDTATNGIAALRNKYGTGHGKTARIRASDQDMPSWLLEQLPHLPFSWSRRIEKLQVE